MEAEAILKVLFVCRILLALDFCSSSLQLDNLLELNCFISGSYFQKGMLMVIDYFLKCPVIAKHRFRLGRFIIVTI